MYSDEILDHFHRPRNVGEIPEATAAVEVTNPACGDVMKLWAVVRDARIEDIKFKVAGCVPAVACGSWLTEAVKGKRLSEATKFRAEDIELALGGLPPASHHASVLAAEALRRLLDAVT
jgi:NifU-like protein involved in Fe-S cluster formation